MLQRHSGNWVKFLMDGHEFFDALNSLLKSVRDAAQPDNSYVKLAFWKASLAVGLGQDPTKLVDRLEEVSKRGKQVRVILWQPDAVASMVALQDHWSTSNAFLERLKKTENSDVYFEKYQTYPLGGFFSGASNHQKIVIGCVDGKKTAIVSGLNMEPQYDDTVDHDARYPLQTLDGVPKAEIHHNHHDAGVIFGGPAVHAVESEWDRRWRKSGKPRKGTTSLSTPDPLVGRLEGQLRAPLPVSNAKTNVSLTIATTNAENWAGKQKHIQEELVRIIGLAKYYIYLEGMILSDGVLVDALIRRIRETSGRIGILAVIPLPGDEPHNDFLSFMTAQKLAFVSSKSVGTTALGPIEKRTVNTKGRFTSRSQGFDENTAFNLADLKDFEGGVNLYSPMRRHRGKAVPIYVHSKLAIIDDAVAAVGSANWNYRSMNYDGELTVFIESPAAAADIRQHVFTHFGMRNAGLTATDAANVARQFHRDAKNADSTDLLEGNIYLKRLTSTDFKNSPPTLPGFEFGMF